MNHVPVIRVTRPFLHHEEPLRLHFAMLDQTDPNEAIAAFPAAPGDVVEFARWAPTSEVYHNRIPAWLQSEH